MSRETA